MRGVGGAEVWGVCGGWGTTTFLRHFAKQTLMCLVSKHNSTLIPPTPRPAAARDTDTQCHSSKEKAWQCVIRL